MTTLTGNSASDVCSTAKRTVADFLFLVVIGALLGALAGTVCLVVLGLPHLLEWRVEDAAKVVYLGGLAGVPLGAILGPLLGWFVIRRVPLGVAMVQLPAGVILGALAALLVAWLFLDLGDGLGLFYLLGGAIAGLVVTVAILRSRFRDHVDSDLEWGA